MSESKEEQVMDSENYEYRGFLASAWDLLRGDTSDWQDRPFYRAIILQNGQPALDIGCGTGRLLLDYLAAGIAIDGVDNSPEMLAICREKAQQPGLHPRFSNKAWMHWTYHLPRQLEDTEDRYEVERSGEIIASELYTRSPATRWCFSIPKTALRKGTVLRVSQFFFPWLNSRVSNLEEDHGHVPNDCALLRGLSTSNIWNEIGSALA